MFLKSLLSSRKARIWTISSLVVVVILGLATFGLYKASQWTNQHTVSWRLPIQSPVVITKKGDETAKVQSLEDQVKEANETLKALQVWASSVDKTLPEELSPKD